MLIISKVKLYKTWFFRNKNQIFHRQIEAITFIKWVGSIRWKRWLVVIKIAVKIENGTRMSNIGEDTENRNNSIFKYWVDKINKTQWRVLEYLVVEEPHAHKQCKHICIAKEGKEITQLENGRFFEKQYRIYLFRSSLRHFILGTLLFVVAV